MEQSGKKKVMVAIDESDYSRDALKWTLENLLGTIDSKLVLFNVQPISDLTSIFPPTYGAPHGDLLKSVQENRQRFAAALLEKAKEFCSRYGVAAETITQVGEPKDAICDAVEKLNIQLLVLGSHGRSAIKRALLGSVSNYCVHNAKCPVLVVKNQAASSDQKS